MKFFNIINYTKTKKNGIFFLSRMQTKNEIYIEDGRCLSVSFIQKREESTKTKHH